MKLALIPALIIKLDGAAMPFIPLGLLSMTAGLRLHYDTDIIDLNCRFQALGQPLSPVFYDGVAEEIVRAGYDVIAFSSLSTSFHHVVSLARRIKELEPRVVVVVGGPGPHVLPMAPRILSAIPCVDYLVVGEGEVSFGELLRYLSSRSPSLPRGIVARSTEFQARAQLPGRDLDHLPFPAFDRLALHDYIYSYKRSEAILHLEEGRGCPFSCAFCATCNFWQRTPRRKSPARVLCEMQTLHDSYSLAEFSLINDCFNADQTRMLKFCDYMEAAGCPYRWGCSLRVDLMNPALFDRLWAGGCYSFFAGIESGSARTQHLIGKHLHLDRALKMLQYAVQKGFYIHTSLITGFPDETEEDLRATLEFHRRCLDVGVAESHVNLLTPLHGSQMLESGGYTLEFDGHGSTIVNNTLLEEHLRMIQVFPDIFASFYYFKPKYVSRDEFVETELIANVLTSMYMAETSPG